MRPQIKLTCLLCAVLMGCDEQEVGRQTIPETFADFFQPCETIDTHRGRFAGARIMVVPDEQTDDILSINEAGVLQISADRGDHWEALLRPGRCHLPVFGIFHGSSARETLCVSTEWRGAASAFCTRDRGQSWQPLRLPSEAQLKEGYIDLDDPHRIYAVFKRAGTGGGVPAAAAPTAILPWHEMGSTRDMGEHWKVNQDLTGGYLDVVSHRQGVIVFRGHIGNRDGRRVMECSDTMDCSGVEIAAGPHAWMHNSFYPVVNPFRPQTRLYKTGTRAMVATRDGGQSLEDTPQKPAWGMTYGFLDANDSWGTLLATALAGQEAWRSLDGGATWYPAASDLPEPGCNVVSTGRGTIFCISQQIHRSDDQGDSWIQISKSLSNETKADSRGAIESSLIASKQQRVSNRGLSLVVRQSPENLFEAAQVVVLAEVLNEVTSLHATRLITRINLRSRDVIKGRIEDRFALFLPGGHFGSWGQRVEHGIELSSGSSYLLYLRLDTIGNYALVGGGQGAKKVE